MTHYCGLVVACLFRFLCIYVRVCVACVCARARARIGPPPFLQMKCFLVLTVVGLLQWLDYHMKLSFPNSLPNSWRRDSQGCLFCNHIQGAHTHTRARITCIQRFAHHRCTTFGWPRPTLPCLALPCPSACSRFYLGVIPHVLLLLLYSSTAK